MGKQGCVYLIGAGPGDIGLLTLKGYTYLQRADVVLYDRLVNPLLLEWAPPQAEFIYCGKMPKKHILRQEAINDLLVQHGLEGKNVVRLKGGDPSVFGRVGEEVEVLKNAGVAYEIVPGITAGIGAAAYADVPVTHREHSHSFAVITGHDKSPSGEPLIDWQALAKGIDTIAFYMGLANLPYIADQLISHGRSSETPVLLIQWGTTGKQRTLQGSLATIVERAKAEQFKNPAIILVGEVSKLKKGESWFESQPLFSQHLLLGRTNEEPSEIGEHLRDKGAEVFEFPRMQVKKYRLTEANMATDRDLLFLSPASVEVFFESLQRNKIDIRTIQGNLYGLSKKTIMALEAYHCRAEEIADRTSNDSRLLIFGDTSWADLEEERERFALEHDFIITHAYDRVHQTEHTFSRLRDEERIDTIIFPNARSVETVTAGLQACGESPSVISRHARVICFGGKSKQAATNAGYSVHTVLARPSEDALFEELLKKEAPHAVVLS
ncbi:uroporphyrinogen-III C-methyltransferase [Oceanobacillus polygoni]|uniref:Uroporphyrinogen-III C-methyltransferase n=1 Tax=Oceanobacillus polygoni TaxID=1235259 RepID=A0A9X0YT10_9BACI|nr:uroporphyrinogen-III C-methyltransferase [Oceanobacillus polygoni]MBP2078398.1 uroporphyrinogen III methyltransferase/synthase [Oceanobacillus polygoni]